MGPALGQGMLRQLAFVVVALACGACVINREDAQVARYSLDAHRASPMSVECWDACEQRYGGSPKLLASCLRHCDGVQVTGGRVCDGSRHPPPQRCFTYVHTRAYGTTPNDYVSRLAAPTRTHSRSRTQPSASSLEFASNQGRWRRLLR